MIWQIASHLSPQWKNASNTHIYIYSHKIYTYVFDFLISEFDFLITTELDFLITEFDFFITELDFFTIRESLNWKWKMGGGYMYNTTYINRK